MACTSSPRMGATSPPSLRVAAMKARDGAQLSAHLSDDLHYAHSNALVDTKASFLDLIVSGKAKYQKLDYVKRDFAFPAPKVTPVTRTATDDRPLR